VRAIVPLDGEPRFRPFPFATPLDGPLRRAVDDAALVLARTKGRFDGPIAFCHGVSRDGAILRRRGRYAEAMVVFTEPSQSYRLGFALGVQLFVERAEGLTLFQQRGPSIGRDPLLWTASASGGLAHVEEPRDAVLADAAEELGLGPEDLPGFQPVAVVVSDDMVRAMKDRAVIVDVAVDQGGCIETIRETTHDDPVYELHGVIHYAVGNMPGAVPHTSTYALTNATLPYLQEVAVHGPAEASRRDPAIAFGVNTVAGTVTNQPVAEFLGVRLIKRISSTYVLRSLPTQPR